MDDLGFVPLTPKSDDLGFVPLSSPAVAVAGEPPNSEPPADTPDQWLTDHSDEWNKSQIDAAREAQAAGLPPAQGGRDRLYGAIDRLDKAGYNVPHFNDETDPTGDRSVTMDMENLVSGLKAREGAAGTSPEDRYKISKERAYWEKELANNGMTADQWAASGNGPEPTGQSNAAPPADVPDRVKPSDFPALSTAERSRTGELYDVPDWMRQESAKGNDSTFLDSPLIPSRYIQPAMRAGQAVATGGVSEVARALPVVGPIYKGVEQAGSDALAGFTSPKNAAMLALFPEGKLPATAIGAYFEAEAIHNLPQQWAQYQASTDPQEKAKLLSDMAIRLGLPLGTLFHTAGKEKQAAAEPEAPTGNVPQRAASPDLSSSQGPVTEAVQTEQQQTQSQPEPNAPRIVEATPKEADATTPTTSGEVTRQGQAEPSVNFRDDPNIAFMTKVRWDETLKAQGLSEEEINALTAKEAESMVRNAPKPEPVAPSPNSAEAQPASTREPIFAQGDTPHQRTENFLNPDHEGSMPTAVKFGPQEAIPDELAHLPVEQQADGSKIVYDPEFHPTKQSRPIETPEERQARREAEAEQLRGAQEHFGQTGDELMDAVRKLGGLKATGSKFAGELRDIREEFLGQAKDPKRVNKSGTPDARFKITKELERLFRKDAPDEDRIAMGLKEAGFDVETPADALQLIKERIRTGKPIYGNESRGAALAGDAMHLRRRAGESGYTDLIPDAIEFGRKVYRKGMDFAQWSAEMVRHLGEKIREQLKTIWDSLTGADFLPHATERGSVLNPANIVRELAKSEGATETKDTAKGFFGPAKFTPFREVLNKWVAARQVATLRGTKIGEQIRKSLPSARDRAAVNVYREAGGNLATIRQQLATPKLPNWFKDAATRALDLSPKAQAAATRLDAWYKRSGQRAQMAGLVEHLRNNYVNHAWKDDSAAKRAFGDAGKLNTSFRPSQERVVPTLFDGAKLGLNPKTMDAAELASIYAHSADRALGDRAFVKDLVNTDLPNNEPLGISQQDAGALAIAAKKAGKPSPFADYKPVRHWAFKGEDYRGDILVHPKYAQHIKAAIETSTIDRPEFASTAAGALARRGFAKLLGGQSIIKQNMLSIPGFHYVQEGTEGLGHHINPLKIEHVDPSNPVHRDAMNHGLMVAGTHGGESQWLEGLKTNRALINKIPGIGKYLKDSSNYLFERYIPSLKIQTYKAALGRNLTRLRGELSSGRMTLDDVKYQTAKQVNDAYGHLNYADMGRSENVQKITRAILLAPDFLEARTRQALQGAAGFIPGKLAKTHGEQRMAFLTLALGQYVVARALNYYLNDDHDLHATDIRDAFTVYHNGRKYSMRSVPGDVLEALTDTRRFLMNRFSPLARNIQESATGLNYRGQRVSGLQAAKDAITAPIPLGLKNVAAMIPGLHDVGERETSWGAQAAANIGVKTQRASPIIDAHKIAHEWMRTQPNFKEDTGSYPSSPYRGLQNALEDKNQPAALRAYSELLKTETPAKIAVGMRLSASKPLTKSSQGDALMMRQLAPEDKATVQKALQSRAALVRDFNALSSSAAAQVIREDHANKRGLVETLLR